MAVKVIVEVHKIQKADGKGALVIDQQLGVLKPALMHMLQKKCDEADDKENRPEATGQAAPLGNMKKMVLNAGVKVFGSALPKLSSMGRRQPLAQVVPLTQVQNKGGSMSSMAAKRILKEDMSLNAATPQYSKILAGSWGKSNSIRPIGHPAGASSTLDAAEEQLISYLMDYQK